LATVELRTSIDKTTQKRCTYSSRHLDSARCGFFIEESAGSGYHSLKNIKFVSFFFNRNSEFKKIKRKKNKEKKNGWD